MANVKCIRLITKQTAPREQSKLPGTQTFWVFVVVCNVTSYSRLSGPSSADVFPSGAFMDLQNPELSEDERKLPVNFVCIHLSEDEVSVITEVYLSVFNGIHRSWPTLINT